MAALTKSVRCSTVSQRDQTSVYKHAAAWLAPGPDKSDVELRLTGSHTCGGGICQLDWPITRWHDDVYDVTVSRDVIESVSWCITVDGFDRLGKCLTV